MLSDRVQLSSAEAGIEEIKGGSIGVSTIPPQGIGAVCLISDGIAAIPYGESYA